MYNITKIYLTLILLLSISIISAQMSTHFVTTWQSSDGIVIISKPATSVGYNFDIDWDNDGVFDEIGYTSSGSPWHDYGAPGTYTVRIRGSFPKLRITFRKDELISIDQWGAIAWSDLFQAVAFCPNVVCNATDGPNLDSLTSLKEMFRACSSLSGNFSSWNTSTITDMSGMFWASGFNEDISSWDVSNVTNMSMMFRETTSFNQSLNGWNTENVTDMSYMFYEADVFNGDISLWDTKNVENMSLMFLNDSVFNQDIGSWDMSNVKYASAMLGWAKNFNQDITGWDVSNMIIMSSILAGTNYFNYDISSWNTSSATQMSQMFLDAIAFNQDISGWNTSNVTSTYQMFMGATSFNQNLGGMTLHPSVNMNGMLQNCGMDCENYTSTLEGWYENNPTVINRYLGTTNLTYSIDLQHLRDSLELTIESGGRGWRIFSDTFYDLPPNTVDSGEAYKLVNHCGAYTSPYNSSQKLIRLNPNGNILSVDSIIINNNVPSQLPVGITSTNGYYQLEDQDNTVRISNLLTSIIAPGNYTANGGIVVRIFYDSTQIQNMIEDPASSGDMMDYGWFKSSYHSADSVIADISLSNTSLPSANEIFPSSSGMEDGVSYVEFMLESFSTIGFFAKNNAFPLPIELSDFKVELNENIVDIIWSTATEVNNEYFIVERSTDGFHFESIKTIPGSGNSSELIEYIAEDEYPQTGNNYYRIKQVDYDGQFSYSEVKSIYITNTLENNLSFNIRPNPSNGKFSVKYYQDSAHPEKNMLIMVLDVSGNEHYSKVYPLKNSENQFINVDLEHTLAPGIYFVTGSSNDKYYHQRIIIN